MKLFVCILTILTFFQNAKKKIRKKCVIFVTRICRDCEGIVVTVFDKIYDEKIESLEG